MNKVRLDIRNTELQEIFEGVDLITIDDLINKVLDYKVEIDSLNEKINNKEE
jgi:hypothetical protein